jgi:hypothetical protein
VSRFTRHLGLVMLEDGHGRPLLKDGRCTWQLQGPLSYDVGAEGSGETITVPATATTDLASIPRFAWSLGFPPDGQWAKAAVIHDFLYRTNGTCVLNLRMYRTRKAAYSRSEADNILREAMGVLGVPAWRRWVIWSAVRSFGGSGWGS